MADMRTANPRLLARLAGVFFLLTILGGIVAQGMISERLIDFRSAAATAENILANRGLFRAGFTVYLAEMACQVVTGLLLYRILRPVSPTLALLMLLFEFTGIVVKTFSRVFYIASLWVLENGTPAFGAIDPGGPQGLSLTLLKVNDLGAATALAFFGFSTLLAGYLVFRSTYLPRWLGIIGMIAGLGWLTFIYPPLGYRLFIFVALVGLAAAAAKIFWLIVFGLNEANFRAVEDSRSTTVAQP
jgi:hypothetical protein